MGIDRRAMFAGLAGLGLAVAAPARAAGFEQRVDYNPLTDLPDFIDYDDEGFILTGLDLAVGGTPSATAVCSLTEDAVSAGVFNLTVPEMTELLAKAKGTTARLRALCAQDGKGGLMALVEDGGRPGAESWHFRQTDAEYQALVAAAARGGLEPVSISIDNHGGAPRFTTLLRRSATAWEARHGLKESDLTALTQAMAAKGFRLARSVPYLAGGQVRFANLYRPAGRHGWQAWVLDHKDMLARQQAFANEGYALLQAIPFQLGAGPMRWSAVWQRAVSGPQDLFWGN
ncbi:hypothetical protein GVN21_03835 [Caulobacter sp. SLTY]|uniref:hypothetical protein n=1 Tax=Caulobacter sp. SLTY TaxID=2683262 RepID=UPI001412F9D5|nr:hypothetical protein [Caulobacter sp. SLTY]NBB14488.1 hypothetical protein [Caulobacter sp. SLTY]